MSKHSARESYRWEKWECEISYFQEWTRNFNSVLFSKERIKSSGLTDIRFAFGIRSAADKVIKIKQLWTRKKYPKWFQIKSTLFAISLAIRNNNLTTTSFEYNFIFSRSKILSFLIFGILRRVALSPPLANVSYSLILTHHQGR